MWLEQNKRYRAKINNVPWPFGKKKIESSLEEGGFTDVTAWKTIDGQWMAEGVWPGRNEEVEPHEISGHIGDVWPV